MTSEKQFLAWKAEGYNWIPFFEELKGDLETPLRLYLTLAGNEYTYLMESGNNGENCGRFSFIGLSLHSRLTVKRHQLCYIRQDKIVENITTDTPLQYIEKLLSSFKVPPVLPKLRFFGGFVGYFGYSTIRYIEPRLNRFQAKDPLEIPDIYLILSDELLVYDNLSHKIYLIVYVDPSEHNAYETAIHKIASIKNKLSLSELITPQSKTHPKTGFIANFEQAQYEKQVELAKRYFEAGDAMQLILSQRFSKPFTATPISLYRALRQINPSPYMFYFNFKDFYVVGASPEILVRLEDNKITVRPLAGTKARGKTKADDMQLEKELLSDTKELAEHLMLIDLGRNDIGRVSEIGSVKVVKQMVIEHYSHVMHISSTVEGKLAPDHSLMDVIKATFPAGTVSGAPKIRAMEIIDELEEDERGLYGGAIGYLGWNGNLDLALALRTAVIKDETVHIQTGAGLVADSIPRNEWQECINKANALFTAVEQTEQNDAEQIHDYNDR